MKTFLVLALLSALTMSACTRDGKNDLCRTWQQPPVIVEPQPDPPPTIVVTQDAPAE